MTKEEFVDWKAHPVTKEVLAHTEQEIISIARHLSYVAGEDSLKDRYHAGLIAGLRAAFEITFEEDEESVTND